MKFDKQDPLNAPEVQQAGRDLRAAFWRHYVPADTSDVDAMHTAAEKIRDDVEQMRARLPHVAHWVAMPLLGLAETFESMNAF